MGLPRARVASKLAPGPSSLLGQARSWSNKMRPLRQPTTRVDAGNQPSRIFATPATLMRFPHSDPPVPQSRSGSLHAWLLLIAVSWGFNWPAVKLALNEMPLWSMRAVGLAAGSALLLLLARASGLSLHVARHQWPALMLAT